MPRIHIGGGLVYLTPTTKEDSRNGWVNVELQRPGIRLAAESPGLVSMWSTTDEKYYDRHEDKTIDVLRKGSASMKEYAVCDTFGRCERLPFPDRYASEILLRQVFEHLSIEEARLAMIEFDRVLQPGGFLRIDVPDSDETMKLYKETGDEFYKRHMLGQREGDRGYHIMAYTRAALKKLCHEYGFDAIEEEPNVHHYPAIMIRFRKMENRIAPWQQNFEWTRTEIDDGEFCVEVGPGQFPWPRANERCDIDPKFKPKDGKPFHIANVEEELPYEDKEVDFIYVSHVLEHVKDPKKAAAELSRVAKHGLIECPHPWREVLGAFEDGTHQWLVWPSKKDGVLRFEKITEREMLLRDPEAQAALCRVFRNGPAVFNRDSLTLRRWFGSNLKNLATVHYWEGQLKVEIDR